MKSEDLIYALINEANQLLQKAGELKSLDRQKLIWRSNANSWNILECVEHLNLYGDFYLPEIESKIKNSKTKNEHEFVPGILGGYFSKSMLPKEKLNKMKTFKDKNPLHFDLSVHVIDRFIEQLNLLLNLLNLSKSVSLNKVKINTSISSFIKLKLGDVFQFFINHMIRHFHQIEKIIWEQNQNTNEL